MTVAIPPAPTSAEPSAGATALRRLGRSPRWWGDAGGAAVGLSLLVVTASWVGNGGLQQLGGDSAESYSGGPVVLLGCGIGVTPLLALLGELPYQPGQATLVYRARNESEIAFRSELEWFAAHRGVRLVFLLGARAERPSWLPARYAGHPDADVLRQIVPGIAHAQVYVCGPEAWTEAARTAATTAAHVHTELFSW